MLRRDGERRSRDSSHSDRRRRRNVCTDHSKDCGRRESQVEDPYVEGQAVRPYRITHSQKLGVRNFAASSGWYFERRRGYVRPPLELPSGETCVIADLGECGDKTCGNYRLGKYSKVRPDFLEYCVAQIHKLPARVLEHGIVLCSLGSGQLLFDWELIERLTEGIHAVRISKVYLIDQDYGGPKRRSSAVRAQRIVAGWFADKGITFQSFLSASAFEKWAVKHDELVDVVLDCDAVGARKRIDVEAFRLAIMGSGSIWLSLSNPAKRTLYVTVEIDDSDDALGAGRGGCEQVVKRDQKVYRRGQWRNPKSVSRSRSSSRRRRRRSCSRDRRRSRSRRRRD